MKFKFENLTKWWLKIEVYIKKNERITKEFDSQIKERKME